jgi:thiol:disulfide interchange protein
MERTRSLLALAVLLGGCVGTPYDETAEQTARAGQAEPAAAASATKPEFVRVTAAERAVDELVREAKAAAAAEQRRVLVYVGASWCEPCQRFHEAVERGQLDGDLAGVRFLEFDADVDTAALTDAGYGGKLIPRFAVPGADGRGSDAKIEGGVKGEAAVAHILERLKALLAKTA